jgi:uncharacterized membrane protein
MGVLLYLLTPQLATPLRLIAAGNAYFVTYLLLAVVMIARLTPADLRHRAEAEDEGIILVVVLIVVILSLCCMGIVAIINQSHRPQGFTLALAAMCAPLGWTTLHVTAAKHYANLFYAPQPKPGSPPLLFPGGEEPGPWDFIYYSFVVGMTAQVSDVQITETRMRRATLGHAVVSFFFNTVLIAMAVNAVVALAP